MTNLNFADLFAESVKDSTQTKTREGEIIQAVVVKIDKNVVILDAGLKSESSVNIEEFKDINGSLEVSLGDVVDVILEQVENGHGETRLSREKAKRAEIWKKLQHIFDEKITIIGKVTSKVKGGFTVELEDIKAFLPGSLVDVRPMKDQNLEGKEFEFKVIKLDQKRNNVVVSRRAILELENSADREELLANLEEGSVVKGIVKNLTDYGAFIDLGGVDGLLHITDMAWKRINHPSEVVAVGDDIEVKVLKYDREKTRVSLGLKQLGQDPWSNILATYQVGSRFKGHVTNITEYGCFVEIVEGIEGLVHVSEMDWTNKNVHPTKIVTVGEETEVQVLEIDEDRRRISLGIKQCRENPWSHFNDKYTTGDRISGKVKSITEFGIFIGLDGGIDGLVHIRDLTWDEANEEVLTKFKKGDTVEAVVLQIDAEKERISLGIKHLEEDSFSQLVSTTKRGDSVTGVVIESDTKGVKLLVEGQFQAFIKSSDLLDGDVEVGSELTANLINIDRKTRTLNLSLRQREEAEVSKAIEKNNVKVASSVFADALNQAGINK